MGVVYWQVLFGHIPTQSDSLVRISPVKLPRTTNLSPLSLNEEARIIGAWNRIVLPSAATWSHLLHALRFWEVGDFGPGDQMCARDVMAMILDSDRFNSDFLSTTHLHQATPHGVRIQTALLGANGRLATDGDPHLDTSLSVLGCLGVPTTQLLKVHGEEYAVADLVRYRIANFDLDRELAWTAVSLALYLPPTRSWKDKYGRSYSFDDLCTALLVNAESERSCYGTHRVLALSLLLHVTRKHDVLSANVEADVRAYLSKLLGRLKSAQAADGSWDHAWNGGTNNTSTTVYGDVIQDELVVTSHLTEALALGQLEVDVDRAVVLNATRYLTNELLNTTDSAMERHYAVYSHAGNALKWWYPDVWTRWRAVIVESRAATSHVDNPTGIR